MLDYLENPDYLTVILPAFVDNRTCSYKINSIFSLIKEITAGVPQGLTQGLAQGLH